LLIALRAFNGQYVCAEGGGGRELVANRPQIAEWEAFELVEVDSSSIALRVYKRQYIRVEDGAGSQLIAVGDAIGPNERFEILVLWSGNIALRAHNGQYVCAEGGGGRELVANRPQIAEWEAFEVFVLRDNFNVVSDRNLRGLGKNAVISDIFFPSRTILDGPAAKSIKLKREHYRQAHSADPANERLEALTGVEEEDISGEQRITSPFDPTLIRIRTRPSTIDLLLKRMREGEITLTPSFQRHANIWKEEAQSRLIESLLLKIPLPAFYFDATDDDNWIVVDGLQRLTALRRFCIDQDLRLKGLDFLQQFHGMVFSNLPRTYQRRMEETQVTIYQIEEGTPPNVKFNIFKRINTGGEPLSAQEIRHALNQGQVIDFLAELASSKEFKKATAGSIRDTRMADRECVLRFLAFTINSPQQYQSADFDSFLSDTMASLNEATHDELRNLARRFKRALFAAHRIFGNDAFRKRYEHSEGRHPISKALFETWSVNLGRLKEREIEVLVERRGDVLARFMELMQDREFDNAISQGTGDVAKVKLRFSGIANLIEEVLK
jgi:hypothetical protein